MDPPFFIKGAARRAMRTNEWQEMSIACLKPSAEQSMSGPCKSSFGAQASEWTRMSSWPHSFVILLEHRLEHAWRGDIERHEDRRAELSGERLDIGLRLLVDIGERELGAQLTERLRASIGDRKLVRHPDDERFGAFEHWQWISRRS